jgi:hypothetical protein
VLTNTTNMSSMDLQNDIGWVLTLLGQVGGLREIPHGGCFGVHLVPLGAIWCRLVPVIDQTRTLIFSRALGPRAGNLTFKGWDGGGHSKLNKTHHHIEEQQEDNANCIHAERLFFSKYRKAWQALKNEEV